MFARLIDSAPSLLSSACRLFSSLRRLVSPAVPRHRSFSPPPYLPPYQRNWLVERTRRRDQLHFALERRRRSRDQLGKVSWKKSRSKAAEPEQPVVLRCVAVPRHVTGTWDGCGVGWGGEGGEGCSEWLVTAGLVTMCTLFSAANKLIGAGCFRGEVSPFYVGLVANVTGVPIMKQQLELLA